MIVGRGSAVVSIVTPTFNSERFLDTTMASVIGQEPGESPLTILYHVQDGGSSDGTLEIVKKWQAWIAEQPKSSRKEVVLTVTSKPDAGMYDAIAKGFSTLPVQHSNLMTWINSDDALAPGAISAALSIVSDFPEVTWLGGRTAFLDEWGAITSVFTAYPFFSALFREGRYDGRERRPFLMQEGTFWRPTLWESAGGLDTSFKLAGDWDLWRRFAEFSDYTAVDSIFAFHRKRSGQLSEDLPAYHAEIDAKLRQVSPKFEPTENRAPVFIKFDYQINRWIVAPGVAKQAPAPANTEIRPWVRKKGIVRSSQFGHWISGLNRKRLQKRRAQNGHKTEFPPPNTAPNAPPRIDLLESGISRHPTKADALRRIKSLSVPIGTVLDVGVLSETPELIEAFGDKFQLLFEPIAEWNATISTNYRETAHEIVNVAVTNFEGSVTMRTESIFPGMEISHAYIAQSWETDRPLRVVSATTIDSAVGARNLAEPFLLKIDVDGAELDVLDGAKQTLGKCSIVIVEATLQNLPARLNAVIKEGFELFDIVDLCFYDETLYQVDLIFINRQVADTLKLPDINHFEPEKWLNYLHG